MKPLIGTHCVHVGMLCTRCGPACLRTLTHSYMPDDIVVRALYVHLYSALPTKIDNQTFIYLFIFFEVDFQYRLGISSTKSAALRANDVSFNVI